MRFFAIVLAVGLLSPTAVAQTDYSADNVDSSKPASSGPAATWTVESLRIHFLALMAAADQRYEERFRAQQQALVDALSSQEKAISAALSSQERAVLKAEAATEKRFEGVNEFRATLSDQATLLMPRAEAVAEISNLREKIDALTTRVERSEGASTGVADFWGYIIGIGGFLVALAAMGIAFRRPREA